MRVLVLIEATSVTGPAKNLLEFARLSRPMGVEVTLAAIMRGPGSNSLLEAARATHLPVEIIREQHVFDRSILPALRAAASRAAPDLIESHAVKSHFLARWSGLARRTPWIAFHHGYTRPAARVALYNQLDRWSLRAARKVITVNVPFRDELVRRGVPAGRIEIVHNAIAPDWGREADPYPAGLPETGLPIILSIGRLSREKDHLTLLHAMKGLDAHLVIAGEGPERAALESAIRRLCLCERVTLAGHQDSVAPYYRAAQAVVISSRSEGSPNVLLEAMASGVPVVATRVGGIPEHVEDGQSALLIEPGDPAAMHTAIARLIGPDGALAQRLAGRGGQLVRERFSPESRVRRLMEIYESARADR